MNETEKIDFEVLKTFFSSRNNIAAAFVFGSAKNAVVKPGSDIDIAIETPLSDYFLLYDFKEELEQALHHRVDIVRLREKMNQALKRRILQDGIYV